MKKLIFALPIILLSFLILYCKKQIDPSQEKETSKNEYIEERNLQLSAINTTADLFALNTLDISVEQGVLNFKDSATLNRVLASISLLEADSAFYRDYKVSIGILTDNSPEDDAFPYMAAYHAFSQRFSNFYTYYEKAEDAEVSFLENGGKPDDIPENEIDDEDLQVILNQYKEVKIGNLIYKYLNEDQFYVITANDFGQLSVLRSLTNPFSAKQLKNTRLIDTRVKEDLAVYEEIIKNSNPESGGPCVASIQTDKTAPNTFKIINTSVFYSCSQQNVYWRITDGNENIIFTSSITDYFTYTIPENTILPVKVTISVSSQCCTDSEQVTLLSNGPGSDPCNFNSGNGFSLSLKDQSSDGESYLFEVIGISTAGIGDFTVSWNYGDGSPLEVKTNVASASHHYLFADGLITYTVKALITWGDGCFKEVILTFEAGCGVQTYRTKNLVFEDAPFNGDYKMRLFQIIKNNGNKYKSTMTFYKKKSNGNFKREKASAMEIDYTPTRFMADCVERTSGSGTLTGWNRKKYRRVINGNELTPKVDRLSTKTGQSRVKFTLYHLAVNRPYYMHLLP